MAERLDAAVGAFDAVDADRSGFAAGHAERGHDAAVGQDRRRHRLEILQRPSEAYDGDKDYVRDIAVDSPVALLALDSAGVIRWANQAAANLFQTSRQAAIGSSLLSFVVETDRIHDILARTQRGESLTDYSLTLRTKTGSTVTILLDGTACLNRGYFTHVHCVLRDITGRLLVEQAYRSSEKRLAAVINYSPTGMFLSDAQGRCTFVNPKWTEMTGMSAELAAGNGWSSALYPDDRERVIQQWEQCVKSGENAELEYRYLKPDGDITWVVCRVVVLRADEGKVTQYLANVTDITHVKKTEQSLADDIAKRKIVEERLRLSEERFELAVSGSNDVVLDWNVLTDEVFFSPRLAELLGYDLAEMQSTKRWLFRLIHPQDRRRTQDLFDLHLNTDSAYTIEHRVRTKGGEYRWFKGRGRIVRDELGRPIRMVGTTSDVTEQKHQEEALRSYADALEKSKSLIEGQALELNQKAMMLLEANRKAEAANEAKGRFLANMSHEIRTPLNAIIGMTELILDGTLDDHPRELLAIVNSSGKHLLTLINDILDFSKIECGKLVLEQAPFSLRDCLIELLAMFQASAREKGLVLRAEIQECVPQFLIGDVGRLRQILVNLVGNAIKFTSRGRVEILVRGNSEATASRWHFTVIDTGIGIPADKQEAIFYPFEQADSSKTRQFGGTGLGLAIVAELVDLMQGRVWVESEVDQGSAFHFEIDLPEAVGLAPQPVMHRAPDRHSEMNVWNVLVAEDSEANQRLIRMLMERKGHTVTMVADGEAMLSAAMRGGFDIILADVHMPKISGLEAVAKIRKQELAAGARRVPIIALTANAMPGDREDCLEAGMDGYVAKPIRREELFAEMSRVMKMIETNSESFVGTGMR